MSCTAAQRPSGCSSALVKWCDFLDLFAVRLANPKSMTIAGTHDYTHKMRAAMPTFTPLQRRMLGFPAVDSRYWTPRTIAAVEERYPGIDIQPMRAALGGAHPARRAAL